MRLHVDISTHLYTYVSLYTRAYIPPVCRRLYSYARTCSLVHKKYICKHMYTDIYKAIMQVPRHSQDFSSNIPCFACYSGTPSQANHAMLEHEMLRMPVYFHKRLCVYVYNNTENGYIIHMRRVN